MSTADTSTETSTSTTITTTSVPAMISVQEARNLIRAHITPGEIERVAADVAVGRVLAADMFSDINVTPFDDSAMDGFCLRSEDIANASESNPVTLTCVAHIGAGSYYEGVIGAGECARIMTGAPVPQGANTVVKIEVVSYTGQGSTGDTISFSAPSQEGNNIRFAGEEAKKGECIMRAGAVITPAGAGLLASTGNREVPVYKAPRVGILTIGSELVDASEVPGPGKIRDSNVYSISAYVRSAGGVSVVYPRVADNEQHIEAALKRAAQECDAVVTTGGACAGDFDFTPAILKRLGSVHFSRVSMKPGKSQPFGEINGKPVFVLSGNPGASAMGFEIFVRPALRLMQGFTSIDHPTLVAKLAEDTKKKDKRLFFNRGFLSKNDQGNYVVTMCKKQSSGLYGSLQESDCLVVLPQGSGVFAAGTEVTCILNRVNEECVL